MGRLIFFIKFYGALLRTDIPQDSFLQNTKSETVKQIDYGPSASTVDLKTQLVLYNQSFRFGRTYAKRPYTAFSLTLNLYLDCISTSKAVF